MDSSSNWWLDLVSHFKGDTVRQFLGSLFSLLLMIGCATQSVSSGPESEEGLDKPVIQMTIKSHRDEVEKCYEGSFLIDGMVKGQLVFNFQIKADGRVESIKVLKREINSKYLEDCLVQLISKIRFPIARNGKVTNVTYPFHFMRKTDK